MYLGFRCRRLQRRIRTGRGQSAPGPRKQTQFGIGAQPLNELGVGVLADKGRGLLQNRADGPRVGRAMADDGDAVQPQNGRAAILGVIDLFPEALERG